MNGCALPVAVVCGSGNQGITCALPVMEYAEYLRCDHERLVRAVMLSDLIAVHIKSYIGALSAFCGAICAACGAGAAITWLCGGTREQIGATVKAKRTPAGRRLAARATCVSGFLMYWASSSTTRAKSCSTYSSISRRNR